jgi:hypothetical protein
VTDSCLPAAPNIIDRRPTVVLLSHKLLGLDPNTTVSIIARQHWADQGCRILAHRGVRAPPPADLAILHVPLTHIPQRYLDLTSRYQRTVNGAVADVSKRRVSADLLREDDLYDGAVMVKTDLNHAGMVERRLRRRARSWPRRAISAMERWLPPHWFGCLPENRYLVFGAKHEVPRWVWRCRGLVVQPLHVERRGGLFALHQWYFLGDHDCVSTFLSHDPVVKLSSVVERLPLHKDVPDAIRRRRTELKFDFGKFDYVIADGVPVLLDANNTPNEGRGGQVHPRVRAICAAIAGGLHAFLD